MLHSPTGAGCRRDVEAQTLKQEGPAGRHVPGATPPLLGRDPPILRDKVCRGKPRQEASSGVCTVSSSAGDWGAPPSRFPVLAKEGSFQGDSAGRGGLKGERGGTAEALDSEGSGTGRGGTPGAPSALPLSSWSQSLHQCTFPAMNVAFPYLPHSMAATFLLSLLPLSPPLSSLGLVLAIQVRKY